MKKTLLLVVVFSMFLVTCELLFLENTEDSGNFWAQNHVTDEFYQIEAQLLAENTRCKVWAEKGSGVTSATAKNIADEYANVIYVKNMNTFGWTSEIPLTNGKSINMNTMDYAHALATGYITGAKLTILLLDIQDGYMTDKDPYVAGYFYAIDFYDNTDIIKVYPNNPPKSNELDMIYIDTYPSVPDSFSTFETLAHEMQHLMNFTTSNLIWEARGALMDTWIDEGLSSAAEWVYSEKASEDRRNWYNTDSSGLIKEGNNFFMWNNHKNNNYANLDDYATVNIFFQYLRLQAATPNRIYFDIHTSEFPDYQAIITANSINNSHKDNWVLLLRDWHAANFINATTGLYGYQNDPVLKDIKAPMVSGGIYSLPLYPGEGVYSKTSTAESVPSTSGKIRYSGLSPRGSTSTPNDTTGFVNGARLTFNIDTNKNDSSATGSTTGIAPTTSVGVSISDGSRSAQASGLTKYTGPLKVDASYFSRRNGNSTMPDSKITGIYNKSRNVNNGDSIIKFDTPKLERAYINE